MDKAETAEYLMMIRDATASDMMIVIIGINGGADDDKVLARCADYAYKVADALRVSRAKTLTEPISKESS